MRLKRLTVGGFTLIEVLAVITLGVLLLILSVTSLDALRGRNLQRAVDQVANLFEMARQEAISTGVPTAAVIVTGGTSAGRALTVMRYDQKAGWKQAAAWEVLPEGFYVELGRDAANNTFVSLAEPAATLPLGPANVSPTIFYKGAALSSGDYAYRVFLPQGEVLTTSSNPITLTVVQGQVVNRVTVRQGNAASRIHLIAATGLAKIDSL